MSHGFEREGQAGLAARSSRGFLSPLAGILNPVCRTFFLHWPFSDW